MRQFARVTAIALFVVTPVAVTAGNGKDHKTGFFTGERVAPQYTLAAGNKAGHCPPGLAKKAVPCVPPGQVKNLYRVGDRIDRGYSWISDPYRYGLKRGDYYVRAGDYVYRIDPDTRKVLNLIGAVADILN